jgi:hypothetical protein
MELDELLAEAKALMPKRDKHVYSEEEKQARKEAVYRWRARNPGKSTAQMRELRARNPAMKEYTKQYDKNRYWSDPEKARARAKTWKDANPEKNTAKRQAWWDANPGARNAARMRYHAAKLQAVPAWANMDDIQIIYNFAKQLSLFTSEQYEVDHIVPLQSDIVCGLHVECNLRVIPASINRKKQNFLLGEI